MRNFSLFVLLLALCPSGTVLAQEPDPAPPETVPAPGKSGPPFEVKLDYTIPSVETPFSSLELVRVPQEATDKPQHRIGIKMGAVEAPLAAHLGVAAGEIVLILDVIAGSPAQKAGLQRYDVITHLDGTAPVTNATLIAAVQEKNPGESLDLRILRRARAMEIAVKIEAPPTIVTTDASGRYRWTGIVSRPYYVTTTSKDKVATLYVTPSVSQRYVSDGALVQQMDQSKVLERLAEMEKRLARMEKLLEEARQR